MAAKKKYSDLKWKSFWDGRSKKTESWSRKNANLYWLWVMRRLRMSKYLKSARCKIHAFSTYQKEQSIKRNGRNVITMVCIPIITTCTRKSTWSNPPENPSVWVKDLLFRFCQFHARNIQISIATDEIKPIEILSPAQNFVVSILYSTL